MIKYYKKEYAKEFTKWYAVDKLDRGWRWKENKWWEETRADGDTIRLCCQETNRLEMIINNVPELEKE